MEATAPTTRRFAARRDERAGAAVWKNTKTSYSLRAVRLELRVLGDTFSSSSASGDTADALKDHCRAHLASYKVPKHIELLPELPKTGSGKISKQRLRDRSPGGAHPTT